MDLDNLGEQYNIDDAQKRLKQLNGFFRDYPRTIDYETYEFDNIIDFFNTKSQEESLQLVMSWLVDLYVYYKGKIKYLKTIYTKEEQKREMFTTLFRQLKDDSDYETYKNFFTILYKNEQFKDTPLGLNAIIEKIKDALTPQSYIYLCHVMINVGFGKLKCNQPESNGIYLNLLLDDKQKGLLENFLVMLKQNYYYCNTGGLNNASANVSAGPLLESRRRVYIEKLIELMLNKNTTSILTQPFIDGANRTNPNADIQGILELLPKEKSDEIQNDEDITREKMKLLFAICYCLTFDYQLYEKCSEAKIKAGRCTQPYTTDYETLINYEKLIKSVPKFEDKRFKDRQIIPNSRGRFIDVNYEIEEANRTIKRPITEVIEVVNRNLYKSPDVNPNDLRIIIEKCLSAFKKPNHTMFIKTLYEIDESTINGNPGMYSHEQYPLYHYKGGRKPSRRKHNKNKSCKPKKRDQLKTKRRK